MKTFLATIFGIILGIAATKGLEILGNKMFPVDLNIDPTDPEQIRHMMMHVPVVVLIVVILSHAAGLFIGLFVAGFIERSSKVPLFYVTGFMLLMAVINILVFPHPLWFVITDLAIIVLLSIIFISTKKTKG